MKQKLLFSIIALLVSIGAWADALKVNDTFTADGITYKVTSTSPREVQVGIGEDFPPAIDEDTTGELIIPSSVTGTDGNNYSVTNIGDYAFCYCDGLTSVSIPNSVKTIGTFAFRWCSGLNSITIPNSVTIIGDYAFGGCSGLTSVTIPNSVTGIMYAAFCDCSSLTSIIIPNSVKLIEYLAFSGCSGLTSIAVENGNTVYDSRNNCNAIIETATNKLMTGCKNTVIPNSVTSIGDGAFGGCSSLTSVTIPYSVTIIGNNAFDGCSSLTSITIPNSVTSIGSFAFGNCSGLTSITVDNGNTKYDSRDNCNAIIETATNELIAGCKNTVIPNSVTSIGIGAFSGCNGLTSINIPNSVTSIGINAFRNCSGLTSINIPNSVTNIDNYAFWYCSVLTSITIGNSVTNIGNCAFQGCSGLTSINIPNSVTSIGKWAFYDCSGLTSINIPNSVTSIEEYVFYRCSGLTSVNIPNSVTNIGEYAFFGCSSLTSITVDNGNSVYDSRDNCNAIIETATNKLINGCKNTVIPNSVTSIGKVAFSNCNGLTSINIPNSVTSIGAGVFWNCTSLNEVHSDIIVPFAIDDNVFQYWDNESKGYKFTTATLYVPSGTKAKYEATDGWKNFSPNIVEMEGETVPVGKALVAGYSSDKALDFTGSDVTAWIATGFREGKIMLSKVDVVPANTGIYVKSTKARNFDVPVTTEKAYYVNMFQPVVTAKTVQPTETVDGVTYQTLSFALSQTTGQPAFFPNTAEKTYGDNKMYLRLPEWVLDGAARLMDNGEWIMDKRGEVTDVSTGDTEPVTIGTLGVAGFSSNRNLDFTNSDVEAWIATGFKGGNVMLSRVYAVPAGTGVYVKSKKTLTQQTTFQIPVTTELPYYVNAFVGLPDGGTVHPTETVSGVTMQTLSFATSKSTGKPAFFPNTADKTYGAGKMYLRLPADLVNSSDAARGFNFVFEGDEVAVMGETTGISEAEPFENEKTMVSTNRLRNGENEKRGGVYDLQGRRMETSNFKVQSSKLKKGMYIVNGKKVVVK